MRFHPDNLQDGILRVIQITLGVVLLLNGIYLLSPWYVAIPDAVGFSNVVEAAPVYARFIGTAMSFAAAGMIAAGFTPGKAKSWLNTLFVGASVLGTSLFVLLLVTRLLTIGFVPFIWTLQLGLMVTSGAIALWQGLK